MEETQVVFISRLLYIRAARHVGVKIFFVILFSFPLDICTQTWKK